VLKAGESYRVPDRPGVLMRTGNAGGLEITVDGKPAPPIGPTGAIRNVLLEPQVLMSGPTTGG
jgi:cytoskeleton protein RodZ